MPVLFIIHEKKKCVVVLSFLALICGSFFKKKYKKKPLKNLEPVNNFCVKLILCFKITVATLYPGIKSNILTIPLVSCRKRV